MSLRFGYFDSEITGTDDEGMPIFDRAETSDLFRLLFANLVSNGVLAEPADCFQVLASEGLTVNVQPGFGLVQGAFAYDDSVSSYTLEAASSSYPRIDRIVLRANYADRKCEIVVKTGTPTATPTAPELLQPASGDYYELSLATIYLYANQKTITQSAITDTRSDSEACGYITQLIDHLDTSAFYAQIQQELAEYKEKSEKDFSDWQTVQETDMENYKADLQEAFETWFADIQGQLSDDAAGSLQEQIDAIKNIYVRGETLYLPNTIASVSDDGILTIGTI